VPGFDEDLLFEAKSMNHTNFLDMKRKGVQESKPVHYAQMQMYMGRLGLNFAMYVAMDKNNCDLYTEFVPFDEYAFNNLLEKESNVLRADHINEFRKVSDNPSWYLCKFCDAKDVCHGGEKPEANCRTCEYSAMELGGVWSCFRYQKDLSVEDQAAGCPDYELGSMWT
jgi:radical SAM protein with 4Fe4S-binding SPASM domain